MRKTTTVLGEIAPEELGFCHSHEHLCIVRSLEKNLLINDYEKSLQELGLYFQAGGRSLVDAQPVGCGRDAGMLAGISENSGIHIIASSGFHKLSYYPENHWLRSCTEDNLVRLFVDELEQGMYLDCDTAFPRQQGCAKAGQIKTALDTEGLTPGYQKLFIAAAEAAKITGCTLMAHIEQNSDPLSLAAFLDKQGLPSHRQIFCHLDRAIADISIHKEICERGIYLEYDTISRPKYHNDEKEADIIMEIVNAGYEKQLLMSLDSTRARLQSYGGSPGLVYILKQFIPYLLCRGLTQAQINSFFVNNPAQVFSR